ncbi:TetR/AcrR family transcriptional regulator [Sphaerisporangium sp. B11E5]|uniref:TetR/AcrR family transcriptional regulator n=1 Tax=Sphaerisporangium sp. B11E5 TaxID=3153563 RepID=UPI00325DCBF8
MSAERGRETRQRLMDAAVALIGEAGWGGVTTRAVAGRAGVNPGLLHYHFASVGDLLEAASADFTRRVLDDLVRRLGEQPDVSRGVEWLLGELGRYPGTDPVSLVVAETFLAAGRSPGLRERLAAQLGEFRAGVAAWLRGHGHGADADAAATLLAAVADGLVLHRALDPEIDLAALAGPLRAMLGVPR